MKYRLKDKALQAKLDALSGGDFSLKLQEQVSPYKLTLNFVDVGFSREKGKNTRWFTAMFRSDEIEEAPQYDPSKWNEWPDVEPPQGFLMRAEIWTDEPFARYRGCAVFDGGWDFYGKAHVAKNEHVRFRPWGAPDKEENDK